MQKYVFFYRLAFGLAAGICFYLFIALPDFRFKVAALIGAFTSLLALMRLVILYLPERRHRIKYLAIHAESKQIIFKPMPAGGYRVALVTITYKRTPEHQFTLTDTKPDAAGLRWDKEQVGVLREQSGRHVQNFDFLLSDNDTQKVMGFMCHAERLGQGIFNAVYIEKVLRALQSGRLAWLLFTLSPTLSLFTGKGQNMQYNTTILLLFAIPLPDAFTLAVWGFTIAYRIGRHYARQAERDNARINTDAVITITRKMIEADKAGNTKEADRLNRILNAML